MSGFKATHVNAAGAKVEQLDEHTSKDGREIMTYIDENGEIGAMASAKFRVKVARLFSGL